MQGRIQDFKLGGGGALKKIAPSGGRHEHFWGISCEKSQFYAKKSYFFPILGGEGGRTRVRPWHDASYNIINICIYISAVLIWSLTILTTLMKYCFVWSRVQKIMGSITGRVKRKDYAIASPSSMQR